MGIDEVSFRRALGSFASGVTVVTTNAGGQLYGITVSAFASLSLHPQLVLICIEKSTPSHSAIEQAGVFAVNILAEGQEHISQHFATRLLDKFAGVPHRLGQTGAPLLEGTLAEVECRVVGALPGGDHTIFLGEVVSSDIREGRPLIYFRSAYRRLGTSTDEAR